MLMVTLGLLASWVLVLGVVAVAGGRAGSRPRELARLAPALARLLRELLRDPSLPPRARWRLWLAVAYNFQPINLVPDFIPVVGLVDNILVIGWALRGVLRTSGPDVVARHWTGTHEDLSRVHRLFRLPTGCR